MTRLRIAPQESTSSWRICGLPEALNPPTTMLFRLLLYSRPDALSMGSRNTLNSPLRCGTLQYSWPRTDYEHYMNEKQIYARRGETGTVYLGGIEKGRGNEINKIGWILFHVNLVTFVNSTIIQLLIKNHCDSTDMNPRKQLSKTALALVCFHINSPPTRLLLYTCTQVTIIW